MSKFDLRFPRLVAFAATLFMTQPGYCQISMAQQGYEQPQQDSYQQQYAPPPQQYDQSMQQQYQQPMQQQLQPYGQPMPQYGQQMQPQYGYGGGYPMQQPQYGQQQGYYQGYVATVAAGTQFQATLRNSINSETTQVGEQVSATLTQPLYSGSELAVPVGSTVIGQVTNVISAKHFKFGANGRIDMQFTQVQTPDGRTFPMSASINTDQLRLSGGTGMGRVGKSLLTTGIGAGGGAALGTGLGAIVGGMSGGRMGMATGMGAVFGSAMGGGVGLLDAGYRKGSEVQIPAGTALPIVLNSAMQVSAAPMQQQMPMQQYGQPMQAMPTQMMPSQMPQQMGAPFSGGYGQPPAEQQYP